MRTDVLAELDSALEAIDRPGTFCASGSAPAVLPGLEVKGIGPIGLPLTVAQAKELAARCEQAPFGKGEKTLVDTNVRRVQRLPAERFTLKNPDWARFVPEIVSRVQSELGLESHTLESHLYDLLLYERGSFFLPHRDGEKLDRMVATLVVALPSAHEGGELVVRHEGQECVVDFGGDAAGAFQIHYAAFYADCEHEVRPLKKGYRLCLVYNLTLGKSKAEPPIGAPRVAEHLERVTPLVRAWAADSSARKLVVTLEHQYTADGLVWDALKGIDHVRAGVLAEAARRADCHAYLALLTLHESGAAEGDYDYSYRRRRWHDDRPAASARDYEMGEIYETSLTAEHWSDPQGHKVAFGKLKVAESELLDPEMLREVDPEEYFEGYTGNAGMTLDRWYRHAAVVLWPERAHFAVVCDGDGRRGVAMLSQMLTRWRSARGAAKATLKGQCVALAATIVDTWGPGRYVEDYGYMDSPAEQPAAGAMMSALAALGDVTLIRRYLADVVAKDADEEPGNALASAGRKHGWTAFADALRTVMDGTTGRAIGRNVRVLEQVCSTKPQAAKGWPELCAELGDALASAIERLDQEGGRADWYAKDVDRAELLAAFARAAIQTGQPELLARVVGHARSLPEKYPLRTAHVPALSALKSWLGKNPKRRFPPLADWSAWCRAQLEALTAAAPVEPMDYRRPARISCKCSLCAELKRFLDDPVEQTHAFRQAEARRQHLQGTISHDHCDLSCRTEKKGSPYTLVCTKTKASYLAALKTYHEDQERLATVRALEAALPGA